MLTRLRRPGAAGTEAGTVDVSSSKTTVSAEDFYRNVLRSRLTASAGKGS